MLSNEPTLDVDMDTDDADITVEEREVDAAHELLAALSENETLLVLRIAAASIERQAWRWRRMTTRST